MKNISVQINYLSRFGPMTAVVADPKAALDSAKDLADAGLKVGSIAVYSYPPKGRRGKVRTVACWYADERASYYGG